MKILTKFAVAAAVALSTTAVVSAPARAEVYVFASTLYKPTGDPSAQHATYRDFTWSYSGLTGTLSGSSVAGPHDDTILTFSQPGFVLSGWDIPVDFTFSASETGIAGSFAAGPGTYTQTGLSGSFHYTYGGTNAQGLNFGGSGINLTNGENILSGSFTDAWIQGAGHSGSANVTFGNGGVLAFTSDLGLGFLPVGPNYNNQFAYNLITTSAFGFGGAGGGLTPFQATGNGIFSIPEPGTWALMIMGFGGIGATLRARRRIAAFV